MLSVSISCTYLSQKRIVQINCFFLFPYRAHEFVDNSNIITPLCVQTRLVRRSSNEKHYFPRCDLLVTVSTTPFDYCNHFVLLSCNLNFI